MAKKRYVFKGKNKLGAKVFFESSQKLKKGDTFSYRSMTQAHHTKFKVLKDAKPKKWFQIGGVWVMKSKNKKWEKARNDYMVKGGLSTGFM